MAYNYDGDYKFSCNRLLLDPKKASLLELLYLLFSSNIKSRKFIECSEEHKLKNFRYRWAIFISVILQKILLFIKELLALVGRVTEYCLNLVSVNGGFFSLVYRILTGKVVKPDSNSGNFRSFIGFMDTRMELDKNIKPGDTNYYLALAMMAAKWAYENDASIKSAVTAHWGMELLGSYTFWNGDQQLETTSAFVCQDKKTDPNLIVISFRGTAPFNADAWLTDVDLSWYELEGVGKIHRGFMYALGLQQNGWPTEPTDDDHLYAYYELRKMLKDLLENNPNAKFIVTGHSLGGALAILFVGILALHNEDSLFDKMEGVYTFGQPRVGDETFGEFTEDKLKEFPVRYLRCVYCNDLVPRIPFDNSVSLYKHFGSCLYYNSLYHAKVVEEEPNKNYFSLLWVVPKILNAIWELIRSFIIPFVKGRDYRESLVMKVTRVVGLVIPGLSAHCPQDYTNSTRLGPIPEDTMRTVETLTPLIP